MPDLRDTLFGRRLQSWRISPTFLALVAALLASAAAMVALPDIARWAVFPLVLAGWLISLCLHEYGHAVAAWHAGDTSVRAKGYLTLDPLRYTHVQYSIVWPLAFLALGGIGLPGGAVYIDKRRMSPLNRALVSAGGPVATVAVLAVLMAAMQGLPDMVPAAPALYEALAFLALLQLTALIFNLLPVPGLDGWGILEPWLPPEAREWGWRAAQVAPLVLVVLLLLPPVARAFWDAIYGLADAVGLDGFAAMDGLRMFTFWR
jgi:Zn-dependent protease